jgi:hypothetical protein
MMNDDRFVHMVSKIMIGVSGIVLSCLGACLCCSD